MFFTDAIEALNQDVVTSTIGKAVKAVIGGDGWKINDKTPLIYEISKPEMKIQFFPDKTKIIFREEEIDVSLTDFSKISFKEKNVKTESGLSITMTSLLYDGKKKFEDTEEKMDSYKTLVSQLSELFVSDNMTPKNQVEQLIEDFNLNESSSYNADLYRLLLIYKDRMETALNNGFLHENSKILMVLEENSGKLTENLGKTVTKGLQNAIFGGVKGISDFGLGLGKAAFGKSGKKAVNSAIDSNTLLILTDKNVILDKQEDINEYDFDDASEIFEAHQDETFVGIVDIYDDSENKIIDNIAQIKWNAFKNQLRKIKKEAGQIGFDGDGGSVSESTEDKFEKMEKELAQFKRLLDNGMITQEDYDAKKAEILSSM